MGALEDHYCCDRVVTAKIHCCLQIFKIEMAEFCFIYAHFTGIYISFIYILFFFWDTLPGVTLDKKLMRITHVENQVKKGMKTRGFGYAFIGRTWGLTLRMSLWALQTCGDPEDNIL